MTYKVTVTEDVTNVSVSGNTTSINITGEQTEISLVNPATSVTFAPSQSFSATNVQDALFEAHEMVGQQVNDFDISLSYGNDFIIDGGNDSFFKLHAFGSQAGWDSILWSSDDITIRTHDNIDIAEFGDTSITFNKPINMSGTADSYTTGFINTNNPTSSPRHHYKLLSGNDVCGFIGGAVLSGTEKIFMGQGFFSVAFDTIFGGGSFYPATQLCAKSDGTISLGKTDARFKDLHLSDDLYANNVEWIDGEFTFSLDEFGDDFIIKRTGLGTVFRADYSTCYLYKSGTECLKTISGGVEVTGTTKSDKFYCSDEMGIGVVTSQLEKQLEIGGYDAPTMRFRNYTSQNWQEGDVVGAIEFFENNDEKLKASIQYEKGNQESNDKLVFRHDNFFDDDFGVKFEITKSGARVHSNFLVVDATGQYSTNIRNTGFGGARHLEISDKIKPDGVYLGSGTTSANLLEDYEEGTWTPTLNCGGNISTNSTANSKYTKIGQQVTVTTKITGIDTTLVSSGNFTIGGLPYQPNGVDACIITDSNIFTGFDGMVSGITNSSDTTISLRQSRHTDTILHSDAVSTTSGTLVLQCTYRTNS